MGHFQRLVRVFLYVTGSTTGMQGKITVILGISTIGKIYGKF
jgi:hypothetical protein